MTYAQLLRESEQTLRLSDIAEADTDAWILFSHVTQMNRAAYLLHGREEAPQADVAACRALLEKRVRHIPVQYLTGVQQFMGFPFVVNRDVLIPRQDTECLVEAVLAEANRRGGAPRILDVCTGSGCIAISLKKLLPQAEVTACDLSKGALAAARENAKRLAAQVAFLEGDLFTPVDGQFDIIVSNPPYIQREEIAKLMPEVCENEPLAALDGGEDGLDFYRRIAREAAGYLRAGGCLYMEIGCEQGKQVSALLAGHGFSDIRCMHDLAGLDRIVCARHMLICSEKEVKELKRDV